MSPDIVSDPWISEVEAAIRTLRDVEGVSVRADGEEIREIHVLTTSTRSAKQIVRDVQTLLLTRFHRPIDHRVVSVAFSESSSHPASAPVKLTSPKGALLIDPRIRFVSANLYVSGPRAQAQVELRWRGAPRMGTASGWSTRHGSQRLIAAATIAAVQEYLEEDAALSLEGVELVALGQREVVVVALELLVHRDQKSLIGCCAVEQDREQAIVLATLNALNRFVGSFHTPSHAHNGTELRPTST